MLKFIDRMNTEFQRNSAGIFQIAQNSHVILQQILVPQQPCQNVFQSHKI